MSTQALRWAVRRIGITHPLARLAAVAVAGAAWSYASREMIRRSESRPGLIDWETVGSTARRLSGERAGYAPSAERVDELRALAEEMKAPLLAFLPPASRFSWPELEVLGRREWVDLNVVLMRRLLAPVADAGLAASPGLYIGQRVTTGYVGLLLGRLSRMAMGQYDPVLLGAEPVAQPRLVVLAPNLEGLEAAGLPGASLRRWVVLHEMAHAWQFGAHPWLRKELDARVESILHPPGGGSLPAGWGWLDLTHWRRSAGTLKRLQALMSVVEGHGNYVMRELGGQLVGDVVELEEHLARRRRRRTLDRWFMRISGLSWKMQQYDRGESFVRGVVAGHGQAGLARLWSGPEALPTLEELSDAEAWWERVSVPTRRLGWRRRLLALTAPGGHSNS